MISAISAYSPYSTYGAYGTSNTSRAAQTRNADKSQSAQRSLVMTAQKVHQPENPVQPVTPVRSVSSQEDPAQSALLRFNSDPAEMAVRMRIQYPGDSAQQASEAQASALSSAKDDAAQSNAAQAPVLPGAKGDGAQQSNAAQSSTLPGSGDDSARLTNTAQAAGADKAEAPAVAGLKDDSTENPAVEESKSAQEVMEEGECQTCKERKYQDGSDDPGVSFKTPTHIAPDQAASAVRGHESEHVVREQAEAQREGRKVVSQSVTYHTDICPECGKVYVSGGTTRTVTKADDSQQAEQQSQQNAQNQQGRQVQQDPRVPFAAVA